MSTPVASANRPVREVGPKQASALYAGRLRRNRIGLSLSCEPRS